MAASSVNGQCSSVDEELREWQIEYSSDKSSDADMVVTVTHKPLDGSEPISFSYPSPKTNGIMFAPWLTPQRWETVANVVNHRKSDVVIATYAKSGTTLVEQATLLFLSNASVAILNAKDKNALGDRRGEDGKFAKVWPEGII